VKPLLTLLFSFLFFVTNAQDIMSDISTQEVISKGMDKMYNFEFDAAEEQYTIVHKKYPDHPVYDFLMAQNVSWKAIYYNKFKNYAPLMLKYLNNALDLADKMLEKNKNDPEGIFFKLGTYSTLALYHSQVNDNLACVNDARKAYSYMKDGFKRKEKYVEFYFSSGLYDYFIVQYPENKPVYKPFLIFFANGDKARGISELDYGYRKARYTKVECQYYLSNIYIKYENTPEKCLPYIAELVAKYPRNLYYLLKQTDALLATGNYQEAERNSYKLYKTDEAYFKAVSYVFYGIINEKHYNRLDTAKAYYNQAINDYNKVQFPQKDYVSFAYAGLARIADRKGDKKMAIAWYKKALDIAEYTSIQQEAKAYLRKND